MPEHRKRPDSGWTTQHEIGAERRAEDVQVVSEVARQATNDSLDTDEIVDSGRALLAEATDPDDLPSAENGTEDEDERRSRSGG